MQLKKNKSVLTLVLLGIILSTFTISCASNQNGKLKRPFNAANKDFATKTVTFNLEATKLITGSVFVQSGDINVKAVKKVPAPKHITSKHVAKTQQKLHNVQVTIKYSVWTASHERTAKVISAMAMQTPVNLSGGQLFIDTIFKINDEYTTDIDILVPKDLDIQWITKTADGNVKVK